MIKLKNLLRETKFNIGDRVYIQPSEFHYIYNKILNGMDKVKSKEYQLKYNKWIVDGEENDEILIKRVEDNQKTSIPSHFLYSLKKEPKVFEDMENK